MDVMGGGRRRLWWCSAPAVCAPRPHRVELDCSKIDAADAADVMPGVCTRPDWLEAFTDYMVAREGGLR